MERLTSDKPTSDMNMIELAHNSCYADEKHSGLVSTFSTK